EAGTIEYVYPLKTDGRATSTLQKFSMSATLKSKEGIQNIYSPTHALRVERSSALKATVVFPDNPALLAKPFRLLFAPPNRATGMRAVVHRPVGAAKGHFLLMLSPKAELPQAQVIPRDFVLVLDTSGSMTGPPIVQARNALRFVLERLGPQDRFGLITFSHNI